MMTLKEILKNLDFIYECSQLDLSYAINTYITNKSLRDICKQVMTNEDFNFGPGSSKPERHHGYKHGLLIHTEEVVSYALDQAKMFPQSNLDVLVTAAVFHDFAKIWDYKLIENKIEVSGPGQESLLKYQIKTSAYYDSIGHVVGSHAEFIRVCPKDVDIETKNAIEHCILAHHGRKEWGSPVEPNSLEALILHYSDFYSSRFGKHCARTLQPNAN